MTKQYRFFLKCIFYLATLVVCAIAIEKIARPMYPTTSLVARSAEQYRTHVNTSIIILGNSHVSAAIDCEYIDPGCFDGSIAGQDLYYTEKLFRQKINRFKNLKLVILELSYLSFGFSTEDMLFSDPRAYLTEFGIWPKFGHVLPLVLANSVALAHRQTFAEDLWRRATGTFIPNYSAPTAKMNLSATRQKLGYTHSLAYGQLLSEHSRAIQSIFDLAHEHHLEVALMTLPMSQDYLAGYRTSTKEYFSATIGEIMAANPTAKYLNLADWNGVKDKDFEADGHHIAGSGKRKISIFIHGWLRENYPYLVNKTL